MRNKPNSKTRSKNQADWVKVDFHEIRLEKSDKEKFNALYAKEPATLIDKLEHIATDRYKLSISYDENNQCFIFSMTAKDSSDPNFNYCMTSRAPSMWEAVALGLYKHYYMCDNGDWGVDEDQSGNRWG